MPVRWYHILIGLCFFIPFQIFYRLLCMICALLYFFLCCLRQPVSSCCRTQYAKNSLPTLITIRFSHYCEKARWALELLQNAACLMVGEEQQESSEISSHRYVERPRSILTHMVSSLWHTSGLSSSTPVYIKPNKHILKDSADIMHYVSDELCKLGKPILYPNPEVEELENYFNEVLGVHVRRYGYWIMFKTDDMQKALHDCWLRGTDGIERWIQQHSFNLIKALATKGMNIEEQASLFSKQRVDEVFNRVNKKLEEHGGLYLFNTAYPTAADFTFASLAYPMILPPQCDDLIIKYDPNIMSRQLYEEVTTYREQPAGKFVLRMYEQHRLVDQVQPNQT